MKRLLVENSEAVYGNKSSRYSFTPKKEPELFGQNPTKILYEGKPSNTCRMFIGFNVGHIPKWNVNYLASLVRAKRMSQKSNKGKFLPPNASFVIQKGLYKSDKDQSIVYEDSVQLIIFNLYGESDRLFRKHMVSLAGMIARELEQQEVIVEMQIEGVPKEVMVVGWR